MTSLFDLGALNVKRADSKAEDIEWLQLDDGAYLSAGYPEVLVIETIGGGRHQCSLVECSLDGGVR